MSYIERVEKRNAYEYQANIYVHILIKYLQANLRFSLNTVICFDNTL